MDSPSASRYPQAPRKNHHNPSVKVYPTYLGKNSYSNKLVVLSKTFPGIKLSDIKGALSKCKGLVVQTTDALLDKVFSEESGQIVKRVRFTTQSKPHSRPRVIIGGKLPKIISSEARKVQSTTVELRGNVKFKYHIGRRPSPSSSAKTAAPKSILKRPFVKLSSDIGKSRTRDVVEFLDVPRWGGGKTGPRRLERLRSRARKGQK